MNNMGREAGAARRPGRPAGGIRVEEALRRRAAEAWDRHFGWYRAARAAYPCRGCMNRTYCDWTGATCAAFRRWFPGAYDRAAAGIRAAAGPCNSAGGVVE